MTWTKLSDDFSDDCWELSDAAVRLHMEGLVWSNRKLLDLRLAKDDMARWARRQGAAEELVAAGWWRDTGDQYEIVHHAAYQRSREAVLKQQEANQMNGRKGARTSREQAGDITPLNTEPVSESVSESKTERDGTGQDGLLREGTHEESESVSVNGDEWPAWRGQGASPFEEYR